MFNMNLHSLNNNNKIKKKQISDNLANLLEIKQLK